ncbi:MAG: 50S ribosomal protein L19e [Candidatus Micrarchaeia archaeon]|jgi:large subunit ribosomal protein L19e
MSLYTVKRVAASILKCGESRVRIVDAKKAGEALTRDDVRQLIREGAVIELPKKGVGRGKARFKQARREAGRRRGRGSRKGTPNAAKNAKERWMRQVRSQRKLLRKLKNEIEASTYKKVYAMIKGNAFKNKKRLLAYLKENNAIKTR